MRLQYPTLCSNLYKIANRRGSGDKRTVAQVESGIHHLLNHLPSDSPWVVERFYVAHIVVAAHRALVSPEPSHMYTMEVEITARLLQQWYACMKITAPPLNFGKAIDIMAGHCGHLRCEVYPE